jgi:integrase
MSARRRLRDAPSLHAVAGEWLRTKQLARRSVASDAARRADLTVIAAHLADQLGRPVGDDELGPMERQLARLDLDDLEPRALREAFAEYAAGHATSSVRRVLSTWRGFCRWLRAEGHLPDDPVAGLEGPGRADWKPKPLELVELARVIEAAAAPDPRARNPWPERDRALVAVFTGAGVRLGEAIALRVDDVEARDRAPRLRLYGKGGRRRVVPVGPEVVEAVDSGGPASLPLRARSPTPCATPTPRCSSTPARRCRRCSACSATGTCRPPRSISG